MTINVACEQVPIDSIKPHPSNPRLGDVPAIAESLEVNGQYSPVVVWGDTIIAGTHTWRAAKSLGWGEIGITRFEGSEEDALRVLIADNRTSDIATYDNNLLLDLLKTLPELTGTGFELSDLDELDDLNSGGGGVSTNTLLDDDLQDEELKPVPIRLGDFYGQLDHTIHELWLSNLREAVGEKKKQINNELRNRLDIPEGAKPPRKERTPKVSTTPQPKMTIVGHSLAPISSLRRFPNNPREGDIGAISESLRVLGQYRPIVVNSRDNHILKGNHTAAAAAALGWEEIAVVWVDVDEEAATKIVLADNKTADRATYDNDLLLSTIDQLSNLEGTGFDGDDYATLRSGGETNPQAKEAKAKFQIGDYGFSTPKSSYDQWITETLVPDEALHRLGLPLTALLREAN